MHMTLSNSILNEKFEILVSFEILQTLFFSKSLNTFIFLYICNLLFGKFKKGVLFLLFPEIKTRNLFFWIYQIKDYYRNEIQIKHHIWKIFYETHTDIFLQHALCFRLCPGIINDTIAGIFSGPEKMLSVCMEHTVWRKITNYPLRGLLVIPSFKTIKVSFFHISFHFVTKVRAYLRHFHSTECPNAFQPNHVHFVWIYFPK